MKLVWVPLAIQDLLQIRAYIEKDNKAAAARIARQLRIAAKRLTIHPEIGTPGRTGSTRELVLPGTPYILPYRVRHNQIEILSVIHNAQEWPQGFV
jgi:toxin ParE1/3/4